MRKRIIYPMAKDNLQLRSKTFLDFTDDPAILDAIIEGHSKADREDFLQTVNPDNAPASEQNRVITFMAFADLCKDKKLAEAIKTEFEEEYQTIFNE